MILTNTLEFNASRSTNSNASSITPVTTSIVVPTITTSITFPVPPFNSNYSLECAAQHQSWSAANEIFSYSLYRASRSVYLSGAHATITAPPATYTGPTPSCCAVLSKDFIKNSSDWYKSSRSALASAVSAGAVSYVKSTYLSTSTYTWRACPKDWPSTWQTSTSTWTGSDGNIHGVVSTCAIDHTETSIVTRSQTSTILQSTTIGPEPSRPCQTNGCGQCMLVANGVEVIYWPVLPTNSTITKSPAGQFVAEYKGTTLTSPTIYLKYSTLVSGYDQPLPTVSPRGSCSSKQTYTDVIIPIPQSIGLSTYYFSSSTKVYEPFDAADFAPNLVPQRKWLNDCGVDSTGSTLATQADLCKTIIDNYYRPRFSHPEILIREYNPAWENCSFALFSSANHISLGGPHTLTSRSRLVVSAVPTTQAPQVTDEPLLPPTGPDGGPFRTTMTAFAPPMAATRLHVPEETSSPIVKPDITGSSKDNIGPGASSAGSSSISKNDHDATQPEPDRSKGEANFEPGDGSITNPSKSGQSTQDDTSNSGGQGREGGEEGQAISQNNDKNPGFSKPGDTHSSKSPGGLQGLDDPSLNPTSAAIITLFSTPFTAHPNALALPSTTLVPGDPAATISGKTISLGSAGVVVDGQTISFSSNNNNPEATPAAVFTLFGQPYTAHPTALALPMTTLRPGEAATISRHVVSLGKDGVVVDGQTISFSSTVEGGSGQITVDGVVFTRKGDGWAGDGTSISRGGIMTVGRHVVSAGDGAVVVDGSTMPLPEASATGGTDKNRQSAGATKTWISGHTLWFWISFLVILWTA